MALISSKPRQIFWTVRLDRDHQTVRCFTLLLLISVPQQPDTLARAGRCSKRLKRKETADNPSLDGGVFSSGYMPFKTLPADHGVFFTFEKCLHPGFSEALLKPSTGRSVSVVEMLK